MLVTDGGEETNINLLVRFGEYFVDFYDLENQAIVEFSSQSGDGVLSYTPITPGN